MVGYEGIRLSGLVGNKQGAWHKKDNKYFLSGTGIKVGLLLSYFNKGKCKK